ncbi:unnamed protein product [Thelazia callipaeda]|uniref:[histone H3]-lysine(36) N-trimethyltransferase n=1 Tax=Thelazia callipaeda TaxID=103827 RepID=A0A0N5D7Z0_THECL|nr:unnamed protein product [Thelazia callipaeda]
MSIAFIEHRVLVEEMEHSKDLTEIVDMEIDDKDEYEITSDINEVANVSFITTNSLARRDVENDKPKQIVLGMNTQRCMKNSKGKRRRSRWDVGPIFHAKSSTASDSDLDAKNVEMCIAKQYEKTNLLVNEEKKINEVRETCSISEQACSITAETSFAMQQKHVQSKCYDKMALPCNSSTVCLSSESSDVDKILSVPNAVKEDKAKVAFKWKLTKTTKELSKLDSNVWGLESETRELPKLDFSEPFNDMLDDTMNSLSVAKTIPGESELEVSKSSSHMPSSCQDSLFTEEIILLPNSDESLSTSVKIRNDFVSYDKENDSFCNVEIEQLRPVHHAALEIVPKSPKDELCQLVTDLGSNSSDIKQRMSPSLQHEHSDLPGSSKVNVYDQIDMANATSTQSTGNSWYASEFCQKSSMEEEKSLSSESQSSTHQSWDIIGSPKTEENSESERASSMSSVSSPSSVSICSLDSTPQKFSLPDNNVLQTTDIQQNQLSEASDLSGIMSHAIFTNDENVENPSAPQVSSTIQETISCPPPYEELDDNVILCDESLIKEAKVIIRKNIFWVVRCFCEPTSQEIAEGRGCSSGCINRELYTECGSRCPSGTGCANRRFHNKQYAKVEVFYAGVKGWGLKAMEPLDPGRFIIEYVGEVIDAEEMIRRGRKYGKDPKHVHHYLMALKNGAVIDATAKGNVSRFINHSCDPNCESQKWTVDRQLRVGFFVIKPIAIGEEIVFDYQLERYGRKAQRCFCGAANCRGRIGDDSESEGEDKISDEAEIEESEADDEIILSKAEVRAGNKEESAQKIKKKKKQRSIQRYNKAIRSTLSRGPPRNRTQVRDLVRLMIQVEQAPQRSSLIKCIRFAHPDVLRLFIQECGLRLLYVFLATDYPIDDKQSVLQLQIKSLDLLDVMPIANKNQINDSHLASTVKKISRERGPVDEIVEDVMRKIIDALCCDVPSTSLNPISRFLQDPDPLIERLHCEMVVKAAKLIEKWENLREEYRIPRRERKSSDSIQHDTSRYIRSKLSFQKKEDERSKRVIVDKKDDGSTLWRLSGFGPPPKKRCFDRHRFQKADLPIFIKDLTHLENEDFKQSTSSVDISRANSEEDGCKSKKRRSRFDIIGERNPSSMYELYATDSDFYAPPPPKLLPESMFAAGLPRSINLLHGDQPFSEYFDWNTVYAKYDPSSAAYQQFIDYYQQEQYPVMGLVQCPSQPSMWLQNIAEIKSILEAPAPPPPKQPKTPEENPNLLTIGPINMDNPTEKDIEILEKHLITLKAKLAEIKKREQESEINALKDSNEKINAPPPPPPIQSKQSLWVQATTEEGAVYYYNKETRESVWSLPDESEGGNASADTTTDRSDTRATFKVEIVKYVGGMLEPIRKLKFASADDYKYVLRKLTHTILDKELKRVGETELRVTESVRDKARKFVGEYLARLGDVKVSRTFPRNKFYIGLLLDWMEQVEERNFRSILSRALINLKAYPLNVETFGDLKIIRGIGDQLAEKLDAAWNAFCSENVGTPTLKQIEQMKRGDFFQYLNSSQISKSQNVKRSKKKMNGNIRDVKFGHSQIRKHLKKSEAQSIDENIYTDAQVSCSQVHRGKREVARGPVDLGKDTETVNACDDSERLEEVCSASQQCDISIVYSPFTFFTSQIILIIDNRESGNPAKFQRMCRLFDKEKIPYEMRSLSVGDYLWILRMHDGSEMVLDYIVERKTNNDL